MSEVYYPRVDVANVRDLQLVVTDGSSFTDLESPATPTARGCSTPPRSATGRSTPTRTAATGSSRPTRPTRAARRSSSTSTSPASTAATTRSYALYDPSLANSGKHDVGSTRGHTLVARDTSGDTPVASAFAARPAFTATSNGFSGVSDGLTDLATDHRMNWHYDPAEAGNLVQVGRLARGRHGVTRATLALGFGPRAPRPRRRGPLPGRGFTRVNRAYDRGWWRYVGGLDPAPRSVRRDRDLHTQYTVAAMTLKAHEDKTYRGANIASLSVPWGEAINADEPGVGGYHLVWARDLYQVATAQLAAGDRGRRERSLDYLFDVQQKPDGSFPQNSLLDGTPYWGTCSSTRSRSRSCSRGSSAAPTPRPSATT